MQTAMESEATARLIEGYLVEHLFEALTASEPELLPEPKTAPVPEPVLDPSFQPLRVGPFRFLCPVAEVGLVAPTEPALRVLEASDLVPATYRARLDAAATGSATVWLDQGRIEVRGCSLEPTLTLATSAVAARDARGDCPWIAGSVREPPAFVLDPQALATEAVSH